MRTQKCIFGNKITQWNSKTVTNEVGTPYLPNHRIMTKALKTRKVTQKTKTQYYLPKKNKQTKPQY